MKSSLIHRENIGISNIDDTEDDSEIVDDNDRLNDDEEISCEAEEMTNDDEDITPVTQDEAATSIQTITQQRKKKSGVRTRNAHLPGNILFSRDESVKTKFYYGCRN